jgi:hypothetical protein
MEVVMKRLLLLLLLGATFATQFGCSPLAAGVAGAAVGAGAAKHHDRHDDDRD